MAETVIPRAASTAKGEARRRSIIHAAAAIIRELGPAAVTHRLVAERAGCSLSATTYYFRGLDDLLYEAGQLNISLWSQRAEAVAEEVSALAEPPSDEEVVEYLLTATLPEEGPYLGHYVQLLLASESVPVGLAYREGRQRLNNAIARTVASLGLPLSPETVIALVDGAAVTALSERRDVRETARVLLRRFVTQARLLQAAYDADVDRFRRDIARQHPMPAPLDDVG